MPVSTPYLQSLKSMEAERTCHLLLLPALMCYFMFAVHDVTSSNGGNQRHDLPAEHLNLNLTSHFTFYLHILIVPPMHMLSLPFYTASKKLSET